MGDFDLPGVKVESQALLNFAKGAAEDYTAHGETIRKELPNLAMKVGLSGLPSGATLGTWNNATLLATMNFIKDSGYGLEAVTTGATSVAAIYQQSDSDAGVQMDAVNSAFYPVSSDATLTERRAEQQQQAEERGEQTDDEILAQSAHTSIMGSQSSTAAPTTSSYGTAPNPYTSAGANALVTQHKNDDQDDADNGGHSEYDEYEAPDDTPEGAQVRGVPQEDEPDEVIVAPGPIEPSGPDPSTMA